jgi:hypothetical protein
MKDLTFAVFKLCRAEKAGGFRSRKDREEILCREMDRLVDDGYKLKSPHGLKEKHILYLVSRWWDEEIDKRTMDNRLGAMRWLVEKIGKAGMMRRENEHYRSAPAPRYTAVTRDKSGKILKDRAAAPSLEAWNKMPEKTLEQRCSKGNAAMAMATGVRAKSCALVDPNRMDYEALRVLAGEAKGTRPAEVIYKKNLALFGLESADAFMRAVGRETGGCLIAPGRNLKQQIDATRNAMRYYGLSNPHSYRHNKARHDYDSGVAARAAAIGIEPWKCPAHGGPAFGSQIGKAEEIHAEVCEALTSGLGHGRFDVLRSYLG